MSAYTKPYTNRNGVTIISAKDFGMDEGLPWYAICEQHHTLVGDTNRRRLSPVASWEFCDCCKKTCAENAYLDQCGECGRESSKVVAK